MRSIDDIPGRVFSGVTARSPQLGGLASPTRPRANEPTTFRSDALTGARFSELLGQAVSASGDAQSPEDRARAAAEQLVSTALVQPILKQLRETSMAAAPFAPTQGEKQFQGLADAATADRIVRAGRMPLVDRIVELTLRRSAGAEVRA